VRDCALGDDGFAPLAAALPGVPLELLDVSGNDLSADSVKRLPETTLSRLHSLALEENELGSSGALALAALLAKARPARLAVLLASTNEIRSKAALALATVLKAACPSLATLHLDANCISSDAIDQLADILGDDIRLGPMDDNDADDDDDGDDDDDDLDDLVAATSHLDLATQGQGQGQAGGAPEPPK